MTDSTESDASATAPKSNHYRIFVGQSLTQRLAGVAIRFTNELFLRTQKQVDLRPPKVAFRR